MKEIMWVITVIAIVGFFLNMNKNKWGYIVWFISNIGLFSYNFINLEYAQAGLWFFYSVMCVYGFIKWQKEQYKGKIPVIFQKDFGDIKKGDIGIIVSKFNKNCLVKPVSRNFVEPISVDINKDIKLLV